MTLRSLLVAIPLVLPAPVPSAAGVAPAERTRTDLYGDPLPDGAVARFGTTRWKHPGGVRGVAFAPDGKGVVAVGDRIPRLWDVATGREQRRFVGHQAPVGRVLLSADGKTLVTGGTDGTIILWDVASGKEVRRIIQPTKGLTALAFARDGKTLASADAHGDRKIYMWDTVAGRCLRSWTAHSGGAWALDFRPDGKVLVSGGNSSGGVLNIELGSRPSDTYSVAAWAPATGKQRYAIGRVVREEAERTPGDEDAGDRRVRYVDHVDPEHVSALAFSSDGKLLATGGRSPRHPWAVRLWDAATGKERRLDYGMFDGTAIAFSPDGSLLGATWGQRLVFWDVGQGARLEQIGGELPRTVEGSDTLTSLAFSPDGRTVACGCSDGQVRLWDLAPRAPGHKLRLTGRFVPRGHQRWINAVAVSPDGRLVLTGAGARGRVWERATGREVRTQEEGFGPIHCAAFSPDGKLTATGHYRSVYLWDARTGNQIRKLTGHVYDIVSLSFGRDGRTLVSQSLGTDLIAWDVASGKGGAQAGRRDVVVRRAARSVA